MLENIKRCFLVNLNEYENIGVNLEINKVVLCSCIVLMLGIVLLNIYRGTIKNTVSQLIRHKALDEESSKTLSELGLGEAHIVKKMLASDNLLTKIVARSGEKKYEYKEYLNLSKEEKEKLSEIDFSKDRFYIREERIGYAKSICEKYGASVGRTLLSCLFVLILSVCLICCMPGILNFVNGLLNTK